MINARLAQDIVDKTMAILGKNINIMDKTGMIIASGHPNRLGTYHEGADRVIQTGRAFEVCSGDVEALRGVQPGISFPILYQNQVVGVVGITGDPEEVRKYGELVRYTAELMLEQASLKEEIYLQNRAKGSYFQDLLTGNWGEDTQFFCQRGNLLGFNLNIPRIVMVLDLRCIDASPLLGESGSNDALRLQRLKDDLLKELRNQFGGQEGMEIGLVGTVSIAFLVPIAKEEPWKKQYRALKKMAEQILVTVNRKVKCSLFLGVGEYHEGWTGLKDSYQEAVLAVDLGKTFTAGTNLFFFKDGLTEYCLTRVPPQTRQKYYNQVLGRLITGLTPYKQELLDTLAVYFEENLNTARTAQKKYVHRNTIMFRLNKIKKLTDYDPYQFNHAFRLRIALMFWKIDQHS